MIERSLNYRRIKKLINWPLIVSTKIIYLIQSENGIDQGLWSFEPEQNGVKIHATMGVDCRGKKAIQSAKKAFKWVFDNTGAEFIFASISRERKDVCYMAHFAGMKSLGAKDNMRIFKLKRCSYV